MRIQDILRTIQNNFYIAFILIVILAVLLGFGYFIIYKKFLKGNKKFSKRKVFILFCLIGYIIMVIGVTFLNRGVRIYGDTNLHLFSSYKEAWNSFNSTTWRFIILNIFMLVPLGILLPLLNKRFCKFRWIFGATFLMTLIIETIQLITGYGIFELDDIFNNVLGAIIGYGIIMTIITFMENRKSKFKKSIIYLIPLILVIVSSFAIVGVYNSKEFGNLYIAYNYKINMKNIELSLNTEIDETQEVFLNNGKYSITKIPIYKAPIYEKDSGKEVFINFLKDKDISKEIEVDPYNDMAIYWSRGEISYNMWFDYNGGTYNYREFSSFDGDIERANTDEGNLLKELEKFNIIIPKAAVFSKVDDRNEDGIYQWSVENNVAGEYITNGNLTVEFYSDESIKDISNNIIRYKKVKDVSIKSKEEAYKELKQGKFNLYKSEDVKAIEVDNINLSYMLDTKGFYQPVYSFESRIDGRDVIISIPALQF
jgi:glycopeptide antibiotics resistance protein